MNITRLLINPDIPEALQLKNGCYCISIVVTRVLYFWVDFDGVETSKTVPILAPRVRSSFDEVFQRLYAKKTIAQLTDIPDDGTFIGNLEWEVIVYN